MLNIGLMSPWVQFLALSKLNIVVQASNTSTLDVEAGDSGV